MKKKLKHIAFIPDGNRRWAENNGVSSFDGHRKGYDVVKDLAGWCLDRGIREMSFWGFSTENWKRTKEEVGYLMDLFLKMLTRDLRQFSEKGMRLQVIGRREDLSKGLVKAIEKAELITKENTGGQFNLCFNYGGHSEILDGVKKCLNDEIDPTTLTEDQFASKLWSAQMSDIDLIVRTSGEQRLSGFQPWKGSYSELYFSDMHWPDFSEEELDRAIDWFTHRERRFGGDAKS